MNGIDNTLYVVNAGDTHEIHAILYEELSTARSEQGGYLSQTKLLIMITYSICIPYAIRLLCSIAYVLRMPINPTAVDRGTFTGLGVSDRLINIIKKLQFRSYLSRFDALQFVVLYEAIHHLHHHQHHTHQASRWVIRFCQADYPPLAAAVAILSNARAINNIVFITTLTRRPQNGESDER
jgi:hypothetical protein